MNAQPPTDDFAEARELQWTWKTAAMEAMAVAICRLALARGGATFSANDLTLEDHGGHGIAGAVFHRLAKDEVITPVGIVGDDGKFYQHTIKNAGGNHIGVWRLRSHARAQALLRIHGVRSEQFHQAELPV
jgi:hypothetical protein